MAAWEEALQNIVWVLDLDGGARARFQNFYEFRYPNDPNIPRELWGTPRYPDEYRDAFKSIIRAQAHNPHAQDTIREHEVQARQYLKSRGFHA